MSFYSVNLKSQNQKFDSISDIIEKNNFAKITYTRTLIDELYEIANNNNDDFYFMPRCFYQEAVWCYEQEKIDTNLIHKIKNYLYTNEERLTYYEKTLLQYSLGLQLFNIGNYADAFTTIQEALNQFKIINDKIFIARSLRLLGSICSNIHLFNLSETYYFDAVKLLTPEDQEYYRIKQNIYRLYILEGNYQIALDSLSKLTIILKNNQDYNLLLTTYLNLGTAYSMIGDLDQANQFWEKSFEMAETIDNPKIDAVLYYNFGVYSAMEKEDLKSTLEYFSLAQDIMERNGNFNNLSLLYNAKSMAFEDLGQLDSALFYLRKNQDLNQRFFYNIKGIESYQYYILSFLEASENKLIIAEQKVKLRNIQFIIIVSASLVIIILILLFLLLVNLKRRKKDAENKVLAAKLEHETKIQQLEKEKQNKIIEAKTREITSYSLLLANKNNVLQEIAELNSQITSGNEKVEQISNKISHLIKNNFNIDEDWKTFKIHFEEVHPDFFGKLKNICPELTEDNLKLCSYFKMGMSAKQIAQILNIEPRSVFKHRTRIKKKLLLNEEESLDDFIRNI